MFRFARLLAVVLLLAASPALAEVDFDEAVDLAASDSEAPKAGDYPTTAASQFSASAKAAVRQCLHDHGGANPAGLQIIVRLGASGAIERVWESEMTRASGCVSGVVETQSFAAPPFAPFHLLLGLGE